MDNPGGDFLVDDAFEDRLGHGEWRLRGVNNAERHCHLEQPKHSIPGMASAIVRNTQRAPVKPSSEKGQAEMSQRISCLVLLLALLCCQDQVTAADAPAASPIKSDEEVVFFPTPARQVDPAPDSDWEVDIHGWIFEPGEPDPGPVLLKQLTGIDLEALQPAELTLLKQRAALFTVDNERGKAIRSASESELKSCPNRKRMGIFEVESASLQRRCIKSLAKPGSS